MPYAFSQRYVGAVNPVAADAAFAAGMLPTLSGRIWIDRNSDGLYSANEGTLGATMTVGAMVATTPAAGSYSLDVQPDAAVLVNGVIGQRQVSLTVDMTRGDVQLDLVRGGGVLLTNGSVALITGIGVVQLLGVDDINVSGSKRSNTLTGNAGDNDIHGRGSNDSLRGGLGADTMWGDNGDDLVVGGAGNDRVLGGAGDDGLLGGTGNDRINGGAGGDSILGGAGADTFVFQRDGIFNDDTIRDFNPGEGDRLALDDTLWAGEQLTVAQVVDHFAVVFTSSVSLDFGDFTEINLKGITTLVGLAAAIDIF